MHSFQRLFLIGILLVFASKNSISQTTFYLSTAGTDQNSGVSESSPWKTIDKLNNEMSNFQAGDRILFKRGDTFYGKLLITKSGITLSAYGSGEKPVISGGRIISGGWTLLSGNIWQCQLITAGAPDKISNFYKEETRLPIGRHPNVSDQEKGYFRFESSLGITQITDNDLNGEKWTGSEIVIKVYQYRFCRTKVTSQTGNTLTIASSTEIPILTPNSGYFFVNSIKTLDQEGEWAYNSIEKKVYIYSANDPNSASFTYTFEANTISLLNASDVTVSDIAVKMGKNANIFLSNAGNTQLKNLSVTDGGGFGAQIEQTNTATVSDCTFSNDNIRAMYVFKKSTGITVQNNKFTNIGMDAAFGMEKGLYCIYNESDGAQFVNNVFEDIGGAAIVTGGKNQLIRRNYINHALMLLDDMGAIYTNNNLGSLTTEGTIVEENIVTNCPGEPFSNATNKSWAHGIYLDNYSSTVTVRNNSVSNTGTLCYFFHKPTRKIQFYGNTGFSDKRRQMMIYISACDREQFIADVHDNILASVYTENDGYVFDYESPCLDFDQSGQYKNMYLLTPYKNEKVYLKSYGGTLGATATYNANEINVAHANVTNFYSTPVTFNQDSFDASKDMLFYYNETQVTKKITLPSGFSYVDVKGKTYSNSFALEPFTSVVLLNNETTTGLIKVDQKEKSSLNVFPNPAGELLWIRTDNKLVEEKALQIISLDGAVYNCKSRHVGGGLTMNIEDLVRGIYIVKVITQEGTLTSKFIKN